MKRAQNRTLLAEIKGTMGVQVAKGEITWKEWSELVSKFSGVHPSICENVLRAVNRLHGIELDEECEHSNLTNNLDPDSEE